MQASTSKCILQEYIHVKIVLIATQNPWKSMYSVFILDIVQYALFQNEEVFFCFEVDKNFYF